MCFKTIICTRGKWVVEQVQVRPIAYMSQIGFETKMGWTKMGS